MAKKKEPPCPPMPLWLVTFSDLMTLLLTFFVLLLTMASMDQSFLTRVTVSPLDLGNMDTKGGGQLSIRLEAVLEYLESPWEVMEKQNRIKDLLYPDEVLPDDISKSTLMKNLKVLARDDGVALVFTDQLLFPAGRAKLDDSARKLLAELLTLLGFMNEPIRISGHASKLEADPYKTGAERAMAVLEFFVQSGIANERFSISTSGANTPLVAGESEAAQGQNRRVEILIRTTRTLDSYS